VGRPSGEKDDAQRVIVNEPKQFMKSSAAVYDVKVGLDARRRL
jgi:hypothetical protein